MIGHNIRIVTNKEKFISLDDLDDEGYEINQSILDGNDSGDIFIESKKEKASWIIV